GAAVLAAHAAVVPVVEPDRLRAHGRRGGAARAGIPRAPDGMRPRGARPPRGPDRAAPAYFFAVQSASSFSLPSTCSFATVVSALPTAIDRFIRATAFLVSPVFWAIRASRPVVWKFSFTWAAVRAHFAASSGATPASNAHDAAR